MASIFSQLHVQEKTSHAYYYTTHEAGEAWLKLASFANKIAESGSLPFCTANFYTEQLNYGSLHHVRPNSMALRAVSRRVAGGCFRAIGLRSHAWLLRKVWEKSIESIHGQSCVDHRCFEWNWRAAGLLFGGVRGAAGALGENRAEVEKGSGKMQR